MGSAPILSLPEKTGPNGEPDHLPDETLRMREPVCLLLAWPQPSPVGIVPSWSYCERKRQLKARKGALTSTPVPCPNPMKTTDVSGE